MPSSVSPSLWADAEFRAYMWATAFSTLAFSMQQLLTNVLFIDQLNASASEVGLAQAVIGLPGLLLMLWGGANADRVDGRALLIRVYALMALPSLLLAAAGYLGALQFWTVMLWALLVSAGNSVSSPALQAMLNRICGEQVQQGVTTVTIIGFLVQMCGLMLAGQIDTLGSARVLLLQAVLILIGAATVTRLTPAPIAVRPGSESVSTLTNIGAGLAAVWRDRIVTNLMALNFLSMLFNAGAFAIVFPFLILKAYHGEPHFLAVMMVVFFGGATASNFLLLQFMPIQRLGRLFLLMQLTRIIVLLGLWSQPGPVLLAVFTFLWGVNMGITSTTARAIVQERAEPEFRGRVMSVLNMGFLGAAPFAALMLGAFVEWVGPVDALLPGVLASIVIFGYGVTTTGIWQAESPTLQLQR